MIVHRKTRHKPCQQEVSRIIATHGRLLFACLLRSHCLLTIGVVIVLLCTSACSRKKTRATVPVSTRPPVVAKVGTTELGVASWYGRPYHGRRTANGEVYDMNKMTAAHPSLAFHTWVFVQNLDNGRGTTVRINDRGPFVHNRAIDLSRAAAREIDMIGPGTARVRIEVVAEPGQSPAPRRAERRVQRGTATPVAYPTEPPEPAVSAARPHESSPPPAMSGSYAIQFGAFRSLENARQLRERVAQHLSDARVVASTNDPSLWLVLAGSGLSHQQAAEIVSRLEYEFVRIFPVSGY